MDYLTNVLLTNPLPVATSLEIRPASFTTRDEVIPALAFKFIGHDGRTTHVMFAGPKENLYDMHKLLKKAIDETVIQASLI